MRLALVYDLRDDYRALGFSDEETAEFDSAETIDALVAALVATGADITRIGHGRALAKRLAAGERYDLVFSIAEGLKGRNREAQVPALCELFDQPYVFSDALTMATTLDKAVAKRLVAAAGVPTTPFAVIETPDDARRTRLPFPLFVKPIAEGTGKGCESASRVRDPASLCAAAAALIARYRQPVLAEAFLPGREFTVGILGTGADAHVLGVLEIHLNAGADENVYTYRNKEECERLVTYRLADDAEALDAGRIALAAYRALQCRDAARLDLRSDAAGVPHFLEANPIAGLHPTHSDLPILNTACGRSYETLIADILMSAAARYGLAMPAAGSEAA